ncbi:transcriptional regulator [Deltaproteobacteria bacterium Smac51]|nr:transcriptional regulator [Deltaproteobacteria bacterium Smac51]
MRLSDIFGLMGPIWDELFFGVIIIDHNGLIVYYNQRMAEMDELTPEEVLGYRINEAYSVRDKDSPSMIALTSRRPVKGQLMHYKTARGRQISAFNYAYPIFNNGELYGAVCLVMDVSSLTSQFMAGPRPKNNSTPQPALQPEAKVKFENIIGKNPLFREAVDVAKVAAMGPSPVMLVGETGTGKDLFAKAIHDYGTRADKPFLALNCSAIPEALLEGILFGTTKGAFTGAIEKEGLLEHSSGGTVFLDEINSMPLSLQAKLLRVMQDHRVRRVGGLSEKEVDLRIISASNVKPLEALEEKSLRADLYYRLGVIQVTIPPLRDRPEDIPPLVAHFVQKISVRLGKNIIGIDQSALRSLMKRPWPGNVRELEHAIESALNFATDGEQLTLRHIKRASRSIGNHELGDTAKPLRERPIAARQWDDRKMSLKETLEEVERQKILQALQITGGQINTAAVELGISPQLLNYKIKKYKLRANAFKH